VPVTFSTRTFFSGMSPRKGGISPRKGPSLGKPSVPSPRKADSKGTTGVVMRLTGAAEVDWEMPLAGPTLPFVMVIEELGNDLVLVSDIKQTCTTMQSALNHERFGP
jgi:hypothetical protein